MIFHTRSELTVMSEINVTPLVDVMLVLLVVFIVTAPLLMQAVKVQLPKTAQVASLKQTRTLQLGIDAQGDIFLDRKKISLDRLEGALKRLRTENADTAVQLQADGRVPYSQVAQAMAVVQRAGISKLLFVTVHN
ncbi:ExbD/TolR family protein [Sulfuriferula sp. GW1]|uniref:ExbD/TolR family protein n=1 Tax=Sulfuriferula sp. GW1 TaxID=3345111 RepID=UPI0039B0E8CC